MTTSTTPAPATTPDPIPLVSSLADIYSSQAAVLAQGPRWDGLARHFGEVFGAGAGAGAGADASSPAPDFIARAPGRVNIIGEHVDHMGFGCLPAAIELDILMAVRVVRAGEQGEPAQTEDAAREGAPPTITFDLRNTTHRFERATFESGVEDTEQVHLLHEGPTRWANYFKVAWKGLHPYLPASALSPSSVPTRIQVLVDGTIPPESSLSSSAAMTVCSSISILEALAARQQISRRAMATVAIESERLVGVASGGMDQAASIFGSPSSALHITFFPDLAIEEVAMPRSQPECTFVIANTLVVSDKKVMGPVQYNLRVVELLVAARVFARKMDLPCDERTSTWRKLMHAYFQRNPLPNGGQGTDDEAAQIRHLTTLIQDEALLPRGDLTLEQVRTLAGYSSDAQGTAAFQRDFLTQFVVRADTFNLYDRTAHVLAEALRVHDFKHLLQGGEVSDRYAALGTLLDSSHTSLSALYRASCPELESVTSIARRAGALGSRLTGAGWGGSTVSLVPKGKVDDVRQALRREYYDVRWPGLKHEELDAAVLVSEPAGGACVYRVD